RTAGINTMAVERLIRVKCRSLIFPVKHVTACGMSPQFQASLHVKWRVLKKSMIQALILAQPVRIVQPSGRRGQMESWPEPVWLSGPALNLLNHFDQFCKIFG